MYIAAPGQSNELQLNFDPRRDESKNTQNFSFFQDCFINIEFILFARFERRIKQFYKLSNYK